MTGFVVTQEIEKSTNTVKKGTLQATLILGGIMELAVLLASFYKYYIGKQDAIFTDITFTSMFIPIFFILYLFIVERHRFSENIGSEVFKSYAKFLVSRDVSNEFNRIELKGLSKKLSDLQGYTYSELNSQQKDMVIYSIANNYYATTWLFSDETLKKIRLANSNYHFHQIINDSKFKIKGKDRFIAKKIHRAKLSTAL